MEKWSSWFLLVITSDSSDSGSQPKCLAVLKTRILLAVKFLRGLELEAKQQYHSSS